MMLNASKKLNEVRTGKHPLALATRTTYSMVRTFLANWWGKLGRWFEE